MLGQGDLADFTVDNIITTLRNSGYGNTPEEKCQEALDNTSICDKEKPTRSKTTSTVRR